MGAIAIFKERMGTHPCQARPALGATGVALLIFLTVMSGACEGAPPSAPQDATSAGGDQRVNIQWSPPADGGTGGVSSYTAQLTKVATSTPFGDAGAGLYSTWQWDAPGPDRFYPFREAHTYRVDFQRSANSRVQDGWRPLAPVDTGADDMTWFTHTGFEAEGRSRVTLGVNQSWAYSENSATITAGEFVPLANMMKDFVFSYVTDNGPMVLWFDGLAQGTYELVTYHQGPHVTYADVVTLDMYGNRTARQIRSASGAAPPASARESWILESDGHSTLGLEFWATQTYRWFALNGFELRQYVNLVADWRFNETGSDGADGLRRGAAVDPGVALFDSSGNGNHAELDQVPSTTVNPVLEGYDDTLAQELMDGHGGTPADNSALYTTAEAGSGYIQSASLSAALPPDGEFLAYTRLRRVSRTATAGDPETLLSRPGVWKVQVDEFDNLLVTVGDGTDSIEGNTSVAVAIGEWVDVAIGFDRYPLDAVDTVRAYINGEVVGTYSGSVTLPANASDTGNVTIGSDGGEQSTTDCLFDRVAVFRGRVPQDALLPMTNPPVSEPSFATSADVDTVVVSVGGGTGNVGGREGVPYILQQTPRGADVSLRVEVDLVAANSGVLIDGASAGLMVEGGTGSFANGLMFALEAASARQHTPWSAEDIATGYKDLGCYVDRGDRDLGYFSPLRGSMWPERCIEYCRELGFDFAGLQAGWACMCGNSYGTYGRTPLETQCQSQCNGDSSQYCGGSWRNRVFAVSPNATAVQPRLRLATRTSEYTTDLARTPEAAFARRVRTTSGVLRLDRVTEEQKWVALWQDSNAAGGSEWEEVLSITDGVVSTYPQAGLLVGVYAAARVVDNDVSLMIYNFKLQSSLTVECDLNTVAATVDSDANDVTLHRLRNGMLYHASVTAASVSGESSSSTDAGMVVPREPLIPLLRLERMLIHLDSTNLGLTSSLNFWADLSGAGNHAVGWGSGYRPSVTVNEHTGFKGVRVELRDALATSANYAAFDPDMGELTMFVVAGLENPNRADTQILLSKGSRYIWEDGWALSVSSTVEFRAEGVGSDQARLRAPLNAQPHGMRIFDVRVSRDDVLGGVLSAAINGNSSVFTSNPFRNPEPDGVTGTGALRWRSYPLFIGNDWARGFNYFEGHIYEVLGYDTILEPEDYDTILAYLENKWRINCPPFLFPNVVPSQECSGGKSMDVCVQTCEAEHIAISGVSEHTCVQGTWTGAPLDCRRDCPSISVDVGLRSCQSTLFADDFGSDTLAARWEEAPLSLREHTSPWSINSGNGGFVEVVDPRFRVPEIADGCGSLAAEGTTLTVPQPTWLLSRDDMIISVSLRTATNTTAGLVFRRVDKDNFYRLEIDTRTGARLVRIVGGVAADIGAAVDTGALSDVNDQEWYHLSVELDGFDILVKDTSSDATVFAVTDAELSFGTIGLFASDVGAAFDDVSLRVPCDQSCPVTSAGNTCEMHCALGYVSVGDTVRECLDSGSWSGSPLTCALSPPVFDEGSLILRSIDEHSPVNSLVSDPIVATSESSELPVTYEFVENNDDDSGNTADAFKIGLCSGQIRVRSDVLDFEVQSQYDITVRAMVNLDPLASATTTVRITLNDINDPPVLEASSFTISEDAEVGDSVDHAVPVTDADGDTLAWSIDFGNEDGVFYIDNDGWIRVLSAGVLDYESQPARTVRVTVADAADPTIFDQRYYTIIVEDANDAPQVPSPQVREIEEGEAILNATLDGGAVDYSDEDSGDSVSFAIDGGADADLFSVEPSTGELALTRTLSFPPVEEDPPTILGRHLVRAFYEIFVRVTDSGGLSNVGNVTVYILANSSNTPVLDVLDGPGALSTRGGETITFTGFDLGDPATSVVTAWYYSSVTGANITATSCQVEEKRYVLSCQTSAGAGAGYEWQVIVDGVRAAKTAPMTTSYAAPTISQLTFVPGVNGWSTSRYMMRTIGGDTMQLYGDNFGPPGTELRVTYFNDDTEYVADVQSVDHGLVQTTTASGVGTRLRWRVEFGGLQYTTPTNYYSQYAAPTLTSVFTPGSANDPPDIYDLQSLRTAGGQEVLLQGSQFGPFDIVPVVEVYRGGVQLQAQNCRKWSTGTAHTRISCDTPEGVGVSYAWRVQIGGQWTGSWSATSYRAPTIDSIEGPGTELAKTEGGEIVYLHGQDFGPVGPLASGAVTYGPEEDVTRYLGEDCQVSVAHLTISCLTSPGVGSGFSWRVQIGGLFSNAFAAPNTGYAPPVVSVIELQNSPGVLARELLTPGNESVVLEGRNFGPDPGGIDSVTYGPTGVEFVATDCRMPIAHTYIACDTVAGAGDALTWRLVVGGQESKDPSTSYAPPQLLSSTPNASLATRGLGSQRVIISGINLGVNTFFDGAWLGPSGTEFSARGCNIEVDHVSVRCRVPSGSGKNLQWRVRVAGQTSAPMEITASYSPPRLTNIETYNTAVLAALPGPTEGGYFVLLQGVNFGPLALLRLEMQTGVSSGTASEWTMLPIVELEELDDRQQDFFVDQLRFLVPEGQGAAVGLRVISGGSSADDPHAQVSEPFEFEYAAPEIDVLTVTEEDVSAAPVDDDSVDIGGQEPTTRVEIQGVNFGLASLSALFGNGNPRNVLRVSTNTDGPGTDSEVPCEVTSWSHTRIVCVIEGRVIEGAVWLDLDGRLSNVRAFYFLSPRIDYIYNAANNGPPVFPTVGGGILGLHASFVNENRGQMSISVDGYNCPIQSYAFDHDSDQDTAVITCAVPEGQGQNVAVVITRDASHSEAATPGLSYVAPTLTALSSYTSATQGQAITLYGDNLGTAAVVVLTSPSGAVTRIDALHSAGSLGHRELRAEIPATVTGGTGWYVSLDVGGQTSDRFLFAYRPPQLSLASTVPTASTSGGTAIVLRGTNFALAGEVTVGGRVASCGSWNHFEITCVVPAGQGHSQAVVVSVADQTSDVHGLQRGGALINLQYEIPSVTELSTTSLPSDALTYNISSAVATAEALQELRDSAPAWRSPTERDEVELTQSISFAMQWTAIERAAAQSGSARLTILGGSFGVARPGVVFERFGDKLLVDACTIEWDQTQISFPMPQGFGESWRVTVTSPGPPCDGDEPLPDGQPFDAVQLSSAALTFSYSAPSIVEMLPRAAATDGCVDRDPSGECLSTDEIVIYGLSFGSTFTSDGPAGQVAITWGGKDIGASSIIEATHTRVKFRVPRGIGTDIDVRVGVRDAKTGLWIYRSNPVKFSYDPPYVRSVLPRPFDANGDLIVLNGRNFGIEPTDVSIFVGDYFCEDAEWVSDVGAPPQLRCRSQRDVVGFKAANVTVALQSSSIGGDGPQPLFYSACTEGFYGQEGELCNECPAGGTCRALIQKPFPLDGSSCTITEQVTGITGEAVFIRKPCPYLYEEPFAQPAWWSAPVATGSDEAADLCHPERMEREACPYFLPCSPPQACLGNNTCEVGYEHFLHQCTEIMERRHADGETCTSDDDCNPPGGGGCTSLHPEYCSKCVAVPVTVNSTATFVKQCMCSAAERCSLCTANEYFRDAGECVVCPDNVELLIAMFIAAAICACIAGYFLNQKAVNMAFLSIGVDYFQILAIFRRSKVSWPPELLEIFRLLSVFNFNLDITAPECAIPDLSYGTKWSLVQVLPGAVACMLVAVHLCKLCYKRVIKGQKKNLYRHTHTLISTGLVLFYYLYLYLLRMQLEVFNCTPTVPSDGHTYADFVSPDCGGLCRCGEGLHAQLLPLAVVFMLVYSFGFPGIVGYVLYKNRDNIRADQIMRAHRLPNNRHALTRDVYELRKRFHKLYYQ